MDAILNNSKRSMMPAGYHSDSDYTLLPLPQSSITWFGGIFARLPPLAAGLLPYVAVTASLRVSLMIWSAQRNGGRPLGRFAEGFKLGLGPVGFVAPSIWDCSLNINIASFTVSNMSMEQTEVIHLGS